MAISAKTQPTQAKVLFGMQQRAAVGLTQAATSRYLGKMFGLSTQQTAAALMHLEDKGLVARRDARVKRRDFWGRTVSTHRDSFWSLTTEGHTAEVK